MAGMRQEVFAQVMLGGQLHHIVSCDVTEGLSRITHAVLEIASKTEVPVPALLSSVGQLIIVVDDVKVRTLDLVVGGGAFLRVDQGSLRYRIELFSPFWTLMHTKDLRKYRNESAKDIITKVLGENGIEHTWEINREPAVRKYCMQYRESHFDFVNRLLEFEGIFFEAKDNGSLEFRDVSPGSPLIEGTPTTFRLLDHAGALEGRIGIHHIRHGAKVATGKVAVNDYNWKTPAVSLLSTDQDDLDSELEDYDYPVGYRKPGQGAMIATRRLEAHRVRTKYVDAVSNVPFMKPGRRFGYTGWHGFAGEFLITEVVHQVRDESFDGAESGVEEVEQTTYKNELKAMPSEQPFRPALVTPEPTVRGAHSAMVRGPIGEEIHTDKYGRFRAQFHWDREAVSTDEDSRWLRKAQESATGMNLSRIGWEVSIAYVSGDPDRPIGFARNINGAMPPTYGQPARKERMTIKTPTYPSNGGFNEIYLEDIAGEMMFDIKAERDFMNFVKHDKTEQIGNNDIRLINRSLNRTVEGNQTVSVGADRTLNVGESRHGKVEGNRDDTVGGNEEIIAGAQGLISVNNNDVETVGGLRFTFAGTIAPPDIAGNAKSLGKSTIKSMIKGKGMGAASSAKGVASALTGGLSDGNLTALLTGNIGRSAEKYFSRTVGGAKIAISGNSISHDAGHLLVETVGGAKLTLAKGSIRQSVGGPCLFTVGGAVFRKSKGDMGIGSNISEVMVGVGIEFASDEKIEVHSRHIRLESLASLKVESGSLSLELTPGKIAFAGPMVVQSDGDVQITAPKDNVSA